MLLTYLKQLNRSLWPSKQCLNLLWPARPCIICSLPTSSPVNPHCTNCSQLYQLFIVLCMYVVCHVHGYKQQEQTLTILSLRRNFLEGYLEGVQNWTDSRSKLAKQQEKKWPIGTDCTSGTISGHCWHYHPQTLPPDNVLCCCHTPHREILTFPS